jgi:CheY-like chemotaxis protein
VDDLLSGTAIILLVDDEPVTREAMVRLLEAADCRVFDTYNGEDALQLLDAHPEITLLLSDVRMPGMTGIELADKARKRRPALKIILTSGYTLERPKDFPFLEKPWRAPELKKLLERPEPR